MDSKLHLEQSQGANGQFYINNEHGETICNGPWKHREVVVAMVASYNYGRDPQDIPNAPDDGECMIWWPVAPVKEAP